MLFVYTWLKSNTWPVAVAAVQSVNLLTHTAQHSTSTLARAAYNLIPRLYSTKDNLETRLRSMRVSTTRATVLKRSFKGDLLISQLYSRLIGHTRSPVLTRLLASVVVGQLTSESSIESTRTLKTQL